MCVPGVLRRRRITRNPTPPASASATAIAAAPAVVNAELDPARPTRTMPVLVTGPFPAAVIPGVGDIAWAAPPPMAIAPPLAVGEAGLVVWFIPPPIAALLVATGGGTAAAEVWAMAGDDGGCVVGGATAEPATVMVNGLGLPAPQSAVTW